MWREKRGGDEGQPGSDRAGDRKGLIGVIWCLEVKQVKPLETLD
jgi:hypothetical protein